MEEKRKKTSIGLEESLWKRARIQAIEEGLDLQDIVAKALTAYLEAPKTRPAKK